MNDVQGLVFSLHLNTNPTTWTPYIANSLTWQKERFEPLNPPFVGMYVCGPTACATHLGNVRTLTFDIVYRYPHLGFKVRYVRNITDVGHLTGDTDDGEDKIGKKARLENLEPMEVVQKYTNDFHDVMNVFNILRPSIEPTATGHILEQIEAIKQIIANGYACDVNGACTSAFVPSARTTLTGVRAEVDELFNATENWTAAKADPRLRLVEGRRRQPPHAMAFALGHGLSRLAPRVLGDEHQIPRRNLRHPRWRHGPEVPHHECEIAQNAVFNGESQPVKYWMHGNMLTVNGRKMAKSEGNGFTPEELITGNHKLLEQGYSPMTVRFFMLMTLRQHVGLQQRTLLWAEKGLAKRKRPWKLWPLEPSTGEATYDVQAFAAKCSAP